MSGYQTIGHDTARTLIEAGGLTLIDVRSPREFAVLGHVPGAWLIPVDVVVSAAAVLPAFDTPVLVYCEHGVRSAAASELLVAAGFTHVLNLAGGMASWTGPRAFGDGVVRGPSAWLLGNADLLPQGRGRVLDLACGRGRHALLMASAGFDVRAVDADASAIAFVTDMAAKLALQVEAEVVDLETEPPPDLGRDRYDVVLAFNYLHRALMPAIRECLAPGGLLFYETFTRRQAERGRPTNPAFLLEDGELKALVAPLSVIVDQEGDIDGRWIASVVAQRAK